MIRVKRVYEKPAASDGQRFLVDRLWPRGVKKQELKLAAWAKDAAPSDALRKFAHQSGDWTEFRRRYFAELKANPDAWTPLAEAARRGDVTLLFSSRNVEQNNATVLREFLLEKLPSCKRK